MTAKALPPANRSDPVIGWRTRPGLTDRPDDRGWRVVHDPVSSAYHRIDPLRWMVLEVLRGPASRDQLRGRIESAFRPRKISLPEIDRILASLRQERLIVPTARRRGSRQDFRGQPSETESLGDFSYGGGGLGLLAITLPSIDPTAIVERLQPVLGRLFSVPAVIAAAMGLGLSLLWWSGSADAAVDRLTDAWANVSLLGVAALLIVIALTKTWHELGHASACHRFGVRCRGIGAMLLVGVPTLYCDATDAWMLPGRWRRSATALAGVYFEIWLIIALTAVVAGTRPGLVHDLALVTITGSIAATILVNLNPLLRFDGYYVLSDWIGVPNLASRGRAFWASRIGGLIDPSGSAADDLTTPQRFAVAVYGAAAGAFRIVVLGVIFAILAVAADWLNLSFLVPLIAAALVLAIVGPAARGLIQSVRRRPVGRVAAGLRAAALLLTIGAAIWTTATWRLDRHVVQTGVLRPADSVTLFSPADAVVERWHVAVGQLVAAGDLLIELIDDDLRLRAAEVEQRWATADARWRAAIRSRGGANDFNVNEPSIPHLRSAVDRLTEQRRRLRERIEQCRVVAPIAGIVRSARWTATAATKSTATGAGTFGRAGIDPVHVQPSVTAGEPLVVIESSRRPRVLVPLDRTAAARVRVGAAASILPRAMPEQSWSGVVMSIAPSSTDRLPSSLRTLVGESVAANVAGDDNGDVGRVDDRPMISSPGWLVTEIEPQPGGHRADGGRWLSGSHVAVRIEAEPRSVWELLRDTWRRHRRR